MHGSSYKKWKKHFCSVNDVACEGGAADVALSKVESEAACIDANLTDVVFPSCSPVFAKIRTELETATPQVAVNSGNRNKYTSNSLIQFYKNVLSISIF